MTIERVVDADGALPSEKGRKVPRPLPSQRRRPGLPKPLLRRSVLRGPASPPAWRSYATRLVVADASVALLAGCMAYAVRFGTRATPGEAAFYLAATLALPAVWVGAMLLSRAYEPRFLGVGSEEFRRVLSAAMEATAVIAVLALLLAVDLARGYVVIALPVATLGTLVVRYSLRKRLHKRRARGEESSGVVAVGHVAAVEALARQVHSSRYHGMRIVAACIPSGRDDDVLAELGIPVLGNFDGVVDAVRASGSDAVAVLPCPELDGWRLRRLGWALELTDADLYVAPAVVEVVGPRISIKPVCGLPLLHVERPELSGVRRFAKSSVDRFAAAIALAVLALPLVVTAMVVRLESPGPVLFRQKRIGKGGRPFTMYKLRTMVSDAELRVPELDAEDEGNGVLFKIRVDPRVTRVGRWLRRYSIDELPQFLNVLRGEMSLVGPRPPLPREVERYGEDMHRRFLVSPGLTGLWQINGRSDLDWDESVRLDVRYVENWSFAFDFMILWKTAFAVLRGRGAY